MQFFLTHVATYFRFIQYSVLGKFVALVYRFQFSWFTTPKPAY
uniref:Uncharacterized protein n=1 Tax=Arundo donax TaxID=35708 RepID=A0A0A8YLP9_ARUDO